ncbi:winged helix-turn-helix transcriptional regulator [Cellvibrio japonicus]|uniref:Transcriptional regulator family n=1 Tax=Cellvibrio japonicus (strain Ueda107) TaxID=498211 RepID=B3PJ23_CELJU|nr:helix-turn-helix domain-containing protein [Cellvibrio japonicus]ACE82683.1 Transcriptional regulator family [Cellvibrio japonicus Ueda107]QEI11223.1 helix-turn-helix transcriptional regulator [Cellvibrio japonicus]QEI14797.1 helix-turn-helix transcriptional regulator [Cellvibrio japonicus]QEI18377.1 helix-turn-helix transcriptional regulator [Cellvibrio japonicus]
MKIVAQTPIPAPEELAQAGMTIAEMLEQGNVFAHQCPSRLILNHVTSRWGVLVLVALLDGTHRFSELRRKIGGVSERMLAQTLQLLEGDGFVARHALPVVPPHVEYTLTPLGQEIGEKVRSLVEWIEGNLGRINLENLADTE